MHHLQKCEAKKKSASTLKAHMLYATLQERHDLRFDEKDIRVAINHEYRDFSFQLHDEDIVVFISPVSGG